MRRYTLIGPFRQLLTMDDLPCKGAIRDDQLLVMHNAGILIENGCICKIAPYTHFNTGDFGDTLTVEHLQGDVVGMPGMIDAHTHICFAGSRAQDFAMRLAGKSYLDIAGLGGGIQRTVTSTNLASFDDLYLSTRQRALHALHDGITTLEIKSGYGLHVDGELKMLRVIRQLNQDLELDIVAT